MVALYPQDAPPEAHHAFKVIRSVPLQMKYQGLINLIGTIGWPYFSRFYTLLCLFLYINGPSDLWSQTLSLFPAKWLYLGMQWLSGLIMILFISMWQPASESARLAVRTTSINHRARYRAHYHFLIISPHAPYPLSASKYLHASLRDGEPHGRYS